MALQHCIGPGIPSLRQSAFWNWNKNGSLHLRLQQRATQLRGCRCEVGGLNEIANGLHSLNHVLVVGVGLPCQLWDCGDVVYRSTLPKQGLILTVPGVLLTLLVATYLWAQPGVAPGVWGMFVLVKLEKFIGPSYTKEDFALGKKLGEGAFETVFKACFVNKQAGKVLGGRRQTRALAVTRGKDLCNEAEVPSAKTKSEQTSSFSSTVVSRGATTLVAADSVNAEPGVEERFEVLGSDETSEGEKSLDGFEGYAEEGLDEGTAEGNAGRHDNGDVSCSLLASRRKRRARLRHELLQLGRSPIQILESTENWTASMVWIIVNTLCDKNRVPEALLVFEWWKRQEGYLADEGHYTRFISICGHAGLLVEAQNLFDEMMRLQIRPTVATYSALLQGYAAAGNFAEAEEVLLEMRRVGLNPNAVTYTGLLYAYGKHCYYADVGKIFNDMKTLQTSQPECAPTSITYSALLQCYAKAGLFAAMEKVLKEMISKELAPNDTSVNAILQGYAAAGLVKELDNSYRLVWTYQVPLRVRTVRMMASALVRKSYFFQLGTFARSISKRRAALGKLTENLLLLSHAANFSMRGLAEEYIKLKESGFDGDVTSFNIRALAFSKMQMFWDLRVIVLEMIHQNVMPDLVTYGAVVDAYVAGNLESKLSEALLEMPNVDLVAVARTDPLVFEAFGRGDFQRCSEVLIEESSDMDRQFLTYANLVGYYLKKSEILSRTKVRKRNGTL